MSVQFPNLFSPIKIGSMTVKNRIVSPGHLTNYPVNNMITDKLIAYHQERAKGGVGLIITESTTVHPTYEIYRSSKSHIHAYDDRVIPWFQKLADAMHEYDVKILAQLSHGGGSGQSATLSPLLAPSADMLETVGRVPREMELDEIQEVIQAFVQAARRAEKGGMDGVEIMGAYGNLIPQFINPLHNWRTDDYGGCLENRLRFATEIIDGIRENVQSGFIIGIRISGDEFIDGGMCLDDMKEITPILATKLDFIDVSFSAHPEFLSAGLQVPTMAIPLGAFVYLASAIKELVTIPVITVGRINDPVQAEKILADGHADLVAMARALIVDPEWPNKAQENRLEDIRVCVACKEGCVGRLKANAPMGCVQNPIVGREIEFSIIEPAKHKKKILVVGGGPAGMEAAWAAALRGHQVILYEKSEQLGGQVLIAAKAPFREELIGIARNLTRQLKQQKERVTVKLSLEATVGTVLAEAPDIVLVATGSTPFIPHLPGVESANVVTDWDVLQGNVEAGNKVVVLDGEGSWRSCSVAELLADKGKQVEFWTRYYEVGPNLLSPDKSLILQRLLLKNVVLKPHTWPKRIREHEIVACDTITKVEESIPADTVVLAMGGQANYRLYKDLKGKVKDLYAIGDCLSPRKLENAIHEGFFVGVSL